MSNRNVFLTVPEAGKFKMKGLADSVSGQSPLLSSWMAVFLLRLHMTEREREFWALHALVRAPVPS